MFSEIRRISKLEPGTHRSTLDSLIPTPEKLKKQCVSIVDFAIFTSIVNSTKVFY